DLEAERKAVRPLDRVQPVDHMIGLPRPQRGPAPEAVRRHGVARLLRLRCSSRGVTCILPQSLAAGDRGPPAASGDPEGPRGPWVVLVGPGGPSDPWWRPVGCGRKYLDIELSTPP